MPKRSSTPKLDPVQNARRVVLESVEVSEISLTVMSNPAFLSGVMAEVGRKGGRIGGKRRLVTMTPERRRQVASEAANARWGKLKKANKK
jgi:hypothetical protein